MSETQLLSSLRREQRYAPNITYIERMSSVLGVDFAALTLADFPTIPIEHASKADLNHSLAEISNRSLKRAIEAVDQHITEAQKVAVRQIRDAQFRRSASNLASLKRSYLQTLDRVTERQRDITSLLANARQYQTQIKTYEKIVNASEGELNLDGLFKNPFFKFNSCSDGTFDFSTQTVTMTGTIGNTKKTVNFGIFKIKINFMENDISVLRRRGNIMAGSHYHPYVGSGGGICWGNGSEIIHNCMLAQDWGKILEYLQALLTTWSPDSTPYMGFDQFVSVQERMLRENKQSIPDVPEREEEDVEICDRCELTLEDCSCVECTGCGNMERSSSVCDECDRCEDCGHRGSCSNS